MKHLVVLLLFMPCLLAAQPAPDFTVTDSDGSVHQLYADYLTQGKTVLIKIFFTTCPPCRALAPGMEPYYEEWGSGEHDVEFFELSDKSFDTDELVNGYKQDFGITFPSAGSEGGSLEAVAPYKNGTYGTFFGTPTFVVIAPDGTVDFNVKEMVGQSIWEALDESLMATGAEKPGSVDPPDAPEPIEIAGKVTLFEGNNIGIAGVEVILFDENGNEVRRSITDATGSYSFSLDSVLVADTILTMEIEKTTALKNGLTATDLLLIQKHLLGLQPLDATEKLFASDANSTGSITAADLFFLKQLLLDLTAHFPGEGESWIFFHADQSLGPAGSQPPDLVPGIVTVQDIISGAQSANFNGIKRGDVNNSADPSQ